MSRLAGLAARLAALLHPRAADARMDEEFRFHLEQEIAERVRHGMSPEDARRRAAVAFGGRQAHREAMRDGRGLRWLRELAQDARFAVRMIRREPSFSIAVVLTLALALGATTAVFTLARRVVMDPLPFPQAAELVTLSTRYAGWGLPYGSVSQPEVSDLAGLTSTFEEVAAYRAGPVDLATGDHAVRVRGLRASAELLRVLRVSPVLGRGIAPDDDRPGATPVAILSEPLWRQLGADSAIVGRELRLNAEPHVVIGVLPAGFAFADAQVIVPLKLDRAAPTARGSHYLGAVGRLRQGVSLGQADTRLATLSARLRQEYTDNYRPDMSWSLVERSLRDSVLGEAGGVLRLLLAAVSLVLLIACANVANLLLARTQRREREIALRTALGARRGRLVRQLLTEGLVLSTLGALAGLALATGGTNVLLATAPGALPRVSRLSLDPAMFLTALALAGGSALLFGLAPALRGVREGSAAWRFWGARGVAAGGFGTKGHGLLRSLVTVQVALAVLVVIAAGLLLRSYERLARVDLGFAPEGVLAFDVTLPRATYHDPARVTAFYATLLGQLRELPGVHQAGGVLSLPLRSGAGNIDIEVEGHPIPPGESAPSPTIQVVTPGFFETMHIPIVRGRPPQASDDAEAPIVAWVNQAAAARLWPGADPVGRRFRFYGDSTQWFTVAGVVGNIRLRSPGVEPAWEYYLAHAQVPRALDVPDFHQGLSIVVRTTGDPALLGAAVQRTLSRLDPSVAAAMIEPMDMVVSKALSRPRLLAALLGAFALLAGVLAAVGISGVLSYAVSQRRREIGIRMALGARATQVVNLIARQGLAAAGFGLVAGATAATLGSGMLRSLLFDIGPRDARVFVGAVAGLALIAVAAAALPALRAARIAPVETLREE